MPNEAKLLYDALLYENGHLRRTQHILKVYGLAKMLGELENLPTHEQENLRAAAILHDIALHRRLADGEIIRRICRGTE